MAKSKKTASKTVGENDNNDDVNNVANNEATPLTNRFEVGQNSITGAGVTRAELDVVVANLHQRMEASSKALLDANKTLVDANQTLMDKVNALLNAQANPAPPQKAHVNLEGNTSSSTSDHYCNDNIEGFNGADIHSSKLKA